MTRELTDAFPYASLVRRLATAPALGAPASRDQPATRDVPDATGCSSAPGRKVLLVTRYDHDDIGGRAVLGALCESLQSTDPGVRITIVSAHPEARALPGMVRVIPRGAANLPRLLAAARRQDVVVVDGGGHRHDDGRRIGALYQAARLQALGLCNDNICTTSLGADPADPAPDPTFALSPAPPAEADRCLRALGMHGDRPVIGVVVRGLERRARGSLWGRVHAPALLHGDASDVQLARVLDQVAMAVETLALEMDAAVLLLPTSNVDHESDSGYCHQLAAMLQLDNVRVAQLADPRLYKAVCGRLKLMISARLHPLLLAAGMGVPGVALACGGEFDRHFDVLGLPRRAIPLDDFRDGTQAERLVALAEAAMSDRTNLHEVCARLRGRVIGDAAALLGMPAAGQVA
jgi:polysaccharide pyruvyl transferase WcaK-like protein